LGISAFGSFIAGTLGLFGLVFLAPPLGEYCLRFGPPEYFSLMFLGFFILSYMSSGPMIKTFMMAALGMILGTVGMDFISGQLRFTYGILDLEDGLGLVPVIMGIFGISEVLLNIDISIKKREIFKTRVKNLLPNLQDWRNSIWPMLRGTVLGFLIGSLPGPGPVTAAFASYGVEKKISKEPDKFGKGAIEGVAGPESANNAGAQGNFIPLLNLGIPANIVMALMLGALLIHGVRPGPFLISQNPKLFWGIISSMYVGNAMLLIMNIPLIAIILIEMAEPLDLLVELKCSANHDGDFHEISEVGV
jgi:putative tricarboxylic transport membrane protein